MEERGALLLRIERLEEERDTIGASVVARGVLLVLARIVAWSVWYTPSV